ncbi:MAG TPA: DUF2510 domain-containing protein [Pseudolysinimonas sp.]
MTDQATRVVSAGWYQDPASSQQVRWWNGMAWTEHTREKPTGSPVSGQTAIGQGAMQHGAGAMEVTETTEQRIAAARDLERQFGIGTAENPIIRPTAPAAAPAAPATAATAASAVSAASAASAAKHEAAHASTAAAWMIALSPILAFALFIVAAYVYFYLLPNVIVFAAAAVVPYALCVLWAAGDGRTLAHRGFHPPSAKFALLTGLGYLIVRRTRVAGSGPIAMLLVVGALAFGAPLVASLAGQTEGLTNALNIQHTVSTDYIHQGKAVSVNCPPFVDAATIGTLYTCDATTATGVHRTIWVSIDGAHGKFSYSFGL